MKIQVLFFASLREALGTSREQIDVPDSVTTVGALQQWLASRDALWAAQLGPDRSVRCALDQAMVPPETALRDGAEVAFFPPVTGG